MYWFLLFTRRARLPAAKLSRKKCYHDPNGTTHLSMSTKSHHGNTLYVTRCAVTTLCRFTKSYTLKNPRTCLNSSYPSDVDRSTKSEQCQYFATRSRNTVYGCCGFELWLQNIESPALPLLPITLMFGETNDHENRVT